MKALLLFPKILLLLAATISVGWRPAAVETNNTAHPFHVAISKLEFDAENKRIKTMHKIFLDDLNLHLQDMGLLKENIEKDEKRKNVTTALKSYCQEHFNLTEDGEVLTMNWVGFELDFDIVYLYVSYPTKRKIKAPINAQSNFLLDLYADQMNIVHFEVNEDIKTVYFNRSDSEPKTVAQP